MSVLRQNQETILTILEVLLYDPLYAWTISPSKAYNIQERALKADINYTDPEGKKFTGTYPVLLLLINGNSAVLRVATDNLCAFDC
jgi:ataxia telangiectasia mutated family protein